MCFPFALALKVLDVPLTVKMRTGVQERVSLAHRLLPELRDWGVALVTVGIRGSGVTSWGFCSSPCPLFSLFGFWMSLCAPSFPLLLEPLVLLPSTFVPHYWPPTPSSMDVPVSSATPGWPTGST